MIRFSFILCIILNYAIVHAQSDERVYFNTIVYINSDPLIRNEVKKFFKADLGKNKCIHESYWISRNTQFIDIRLFTPSQYFNQIFVQYDTIRSAEQFKNVYFGLQRDGKLENLTIAYEGQPLRLVFSKPIGNVLLAELLLDHDPVGDYKEVTRLGKGLRLLIYFDPLGKIVRVFSAGIKYG